jgi:hypothetical protein
MNRSRWTDACFFGAWVNGLERRLQLWVLAVPGWPPRQRPKLAFGSTAGVLVAGDGLTAGVLVAGDGSTAGVVVVLAAVGSIGGE